MPVADFWDFADTGKAIDTVTLPFTWPSQFVSYVWGIKKGTPKLEPGTTGAGSSPPPLPSDWSLTKWLGYEPGKGPLDNLETIVKYATIALGLGLVLYVLVLVF